MKNNFDTFKIDKKTIINELQLNSLLFFVEIKCAVKKKIP